MAEEGTIPGSLATDCDTDGAPTLPFDCTLDIDIQSDTENLNCSAGKRKAEAISDSSSSSDSSEAQSDSDTQSDDDCASTETADILEPIENNTSDSLHEDQIVHSLEQLFLDDHQNAHGVNIINPDEHVLRDRDGDTKLHVALIFMAFRYIRLMLKSNNISSYVNIRNNLFQTALHLAVDKTIKAPIDIIIELLRVGADPIIQDIKGRTALHIVCENGDIGTLIFLYAMHIVGDENRIKESIRHCLNMHTYDGLTCLHIAVKLHDVPVVNMLLNWGSDANIRDRKSGRTALHFAAEKGSTEIVKILVNRPDVNIEMENYNKETPLILAYHRKHDDVVQLLVDKGAECNMHDIKNFGPVRRKFLKTTNR